MHSKATVLRESSICTNRIQHTKRLYDPLQDPSPSPSSPSTSFTPIAVSTETSRPVISYCVPTAPSVWVSSPRANPSPMHCGSGMTLPSPV